MSDVFFQATHPRARKQHRCDMCRRTIEVGEIYRRQGYIWDGRADSNHLCSQCEAFAKALHSVGFENDEGGWPWIGDLEQGEVAYCGYGIELGRFRGGWRNDDGTLYDWAANHANRSNEGEER